MLMVITSVLRSAGSSALLLASKDSRVRVKVSPSACSAVSMVTNEAVEERENSMNECSVPDYSLKEMARTLVIGTSG